MPSSYPLNAEPVGTPRSLIRAFRVEALGESGEWTVVARKEENYQRLVRMDVDVRTTALRFIPEATWGADRCHVFAWDVGA